MDQTFYKLFVKAWNFPGTLQSLSRHTDVPRHRHSLGNPSLESLV